MTINFVKLQAPIPKDQIGTKTLGGKRMSFINARTVMNRLDEVAGPANWYDEYREVDGGILCTLYLKVGEEWVGKSDVGDQDGADFSPFKGMYSDALKRAAGRWGIGRELYGDGTANLSGEQPAPHQDTPRAQPKARAPHSAPPPTGDDFPTRSSVWTGVASGLLTMQVSDLPMPVGGIIYPAATAQLGLSSDDVKEYLQLDSLNEWQGTLEGLMDRVIDLANEGLRR